MNEYRTISRSGVGVINIKVTEKNGKVTGIASVKKEDEMFSDRPNGKCAFLLCFSCVGSPDKGATQNG